MGRSSLAGASSLVAFAKQAWLLRHDITRPVLPSAAREGDVAVCLHGLFATAGVLRPLRRRIERLGIATATFTFGLGPGIDELTAQLDHVASSLHPEARLHLIGHSLGGVVARHYALGAPARPVVQTLSLGAPFAGVPSARWMAGVIPPGSAALARDLAPESALLRRIRLAEEPIPHLSILARKDGVVRRPASHALPGGEVRWVERCGHNQLLYHPDTLRFIAERLVPTGDGPGSAPSEAVER